MAGFVILGHRDILSGMNVSLTPELKRIVNQRVASGLYGSASEVVRAALRLLAAQEEFHKIQLAGLRKQVAVGLDQLDRGQRRPFDAAMVASIKAQGRKRLRER